MSTQATDDQFLRVCRIEQTSFLATEHMRWYDDQIADLQERHRAEMRSAGHEIGDLQCAVAAGVEREVAQCRVIWWWKLGCFGALTVAGCAVLWALQVCGRLG